METGMPLNIIKLMIDTDEATVSKRLDILHEQIKVRKHELKVLEQFKRDFEKKHSLRL